MLYLTCPHCDTPLRVQHEVATPWLSCFCCGKLIPNPDVSPDGNPEIATPDEAGITVPVEGADAVMPASRGVLIVRSMFIVLGCMGALSIGWLIVWRSGFSRLDLLAIDGGLLFGSLFLALSSYRPYWLGWLILFFFGIFGGLHLLLLLVLLIY